MADSRPLRSVEGIPGRTIWVFGLALASLTAYLVFSPAVRMVSAQLAYLNRMMRGFAEARDTRAFDIGLSPSVPSLVAFGVYCASCLGVALLVRHALRGRREAVPAAWVSGLAASVVPTLLIAMVRWPDGGGSITDVTICVAQLVTLAAVWVWSRRPRGAVVGPAAESAGADAPGDRMSPWLLPLLGLAALYVLTVVLSGLSGIFGYDSFSDHLVVPARWLQSGRLVRGLPEEIVTFYPGNFELLVRWTQTLGTDRLAFLLSLASGIAAVWVVYRISLELGQSRTAAVMSALAAASMPVVAYQGVVVYSDTYTALCLLLATWLLLVFARDGHQTPGLSLVFGIALGLGLGAKYSAGPPGVVLGSLWLYYAWRGSWSMPAGGVAQLQWRPFFRHMVWMTIGFVPPFAYWYVYNMVTVGNPLYPLSVAGLPGIEIGSLLAGAPGPKTFFQLLTWAWTEYAHGPGYETGLGPAFATFAVIGACALPFMKRRPNSTVLLAWVILVVAAIAWWRTGVLVTRYGLFPLLLSFVFVGELWSAYRSRWLGALFGAVVSVTMLSVGHEMLGGAAYAGVMYDPVPPVPAVVDDLPPSRILNAVGQPSGYYLRGTDQRHRVFSPFQIVTVEYVRGLAPDYVLLPEAREAEFVGPLSLELVGRWTKDGQAGTSLWRVP